MNDQRAHRQHARASLVIGVIVVGGFLLWAVAQSNLPTALVRLFRTYL